MKEKDKTYSWNDISFRQFQEIKTVLDDIEDETDRSVRIAQIIYGDDIIQLPIQTFNKLCSGLSFLSTEVPHDITVKEVTVNGRQYYFDGLLGKITTAQYIDFQNYLRNNDEVKCFSVFMIPKGHKYNDGYDMLEVFEDIQDMPIPILYSASFFFNRQFATFIKIFQHYSMKQLKKLKLPKEVKQNMEKAVENSNNLVQYLLSQSFAK